MLRKFLNTLVPPDILNTVSLLRRPWKSRNLIIKIVFRICEYPHSQWQRVQVGDSRENHYQFLKIIVGMTCFMVMKLEILSWKFNESNIFWLTRRKPWFNCDALLMTSVDWRINILISKRDGVNSSIHLGYKMW